MVEDKLRDDEWKCNRCGRILKKDKACTCFRKRKNDAEKDGNVTYIEYKPEYEEGRNDGGIW